MATTLRERLIIREQQLNLTVDALEFLLPLAGSEGYRMVIRETLRRVSLLHAQELEDHGNDLNSVLLTRNES
jgi:hypothetical protein